MAAAPTTLLCSADGAVVPLLVDRWTATPTIEELVVLDRVVGPALDVGCGPGRHVSELAARGVLALGIDISAEATATAAKLESIVLRRSVFDRLPNEGHWRTALLMDGNIGIGGDARALLGRLRQILVPGGSVMVEVEAPGAPTTVELMRVERGDVAGPWFPWARVSIDHVDAIAADVELSRVWTHGEEDRWFVELKS